MPVRRRGSEHVRTQFVAAHLSLSRIFNGAAMLSRNDTIRFVDPVPDVSLLDPVANPASEFRLPADDLDSAFQGSHFYGVYKCTCTSSTSLFVVTQYKDICRLPTMKWGSYQDFIDAAVKEFGGNQSALARAVNKMLPKEEQITAQAIQYLQKRTGKPARKSGLTHIIAQVAGLNPPGINGGELRATSPPVLERSQEIDDVELSKAALELIRAWNALPLNERMVIKRRVESAALRYLDPVPDEQLTDLAAPGTPTAEKAKTPPDKPKSGKKTRQPGTH